MSGATVAFAGALVYAHRELTLLLDEHLEENDNELLPHPFLSDVVRWMVARIDTDYPTCNRILRWMERAYKEGSNEIRGLIQVSFVEMIPDPGLPGSGLRLMLGPNLDSIDPFGRGAQ
ncbi:DUF7674 family protein [Cellulosimicrobium cellulans]|uniref:DUF7674 family protein n=1 Tax=Cellulosimicrobium cellulans TaxID=1710 RepID=UPI00240685D2|nr:hypothetical protein [Cellulosimicrobium cellulans]MDF9876157.1 hypothetical protein [Cellulosimicrobium cellulans]